MRIEVGYVGMWRAWGAGAECQQGARYFCGGPGAWSRLPTDPPPAGWRPDTERCRRCSQTLNGHRELPVITVGEAFAALCRPHSAGRPSVGASRVTSGASSHSLAGASRMTAGASRVTAGASTPYASSAGASREPAEGRVAAGASRELAIRCSLNCARSALSSESL